MAVQQLYTVQQNLPDHAGRLSWHDLTGPLSAALANLIYQQKTGLSGPTTKQFRIWPYQTIAHKPPHTGIH